MEKDYSDPVEVLKYDYAGVAIGALGDARILGNLVGFAASLKYYSEMVRDSFPQQEKAKKKQPAATKLDVNFNDPVALLEYDPAGVAIRTKGNPEMLDQLVKFASSMEHYAGLIRKNIMAPTSRPDNASSSFNSQAEPVLPTSMASDENSSSGGMEDAIVIDSEEDERKIEARKPAKKRKLEHESKDEEEKKEDESPLLATQTTTCSSLWQMLKESPLRHSIGLSRRMIGNHSKKLGLADSSNRAVAKVKGSDKVSHLILQCEWIDFSFEERENFQWTLETTDFNLKLVHCLDPSKHEQGEVIVFLYRKENIGYTNKLYYIGHYQCVTLTRINTMHDKDQLELDFKYVRFDKTLADKMKDLAS